MNCQARLYLPRMHTKSLACNPGSYAGFVLALGKIEGIVGGQAAKVALGEAFSQQLRGGFELAGLADT
jgi:hypothetical protein